MHTREYPWIILEEVSSSHSAKCCISFRGGSGAFKGFHSCLSHGFGDDRCNGGGSEMKCAISPRLIIRCLAEDGALKSCRLSRFSGFGYTRRYESAPKLSSSMVLLVESSVLVFHNVHCNLTKTSRSRVSLCKNERRRLPNSVTDLAKPVESVS